MQGRGLGPKTLGWHSGEPLSMPSSAAKVPTGPVAELPQHHPPSFVRPGLARQGLPTGMYSS